MKKIRDISTIMAKSEKKADQYENAVEQGAIYVSLDGSRRFDLDKFAETSSGRKKLLELLIEDSSCDKR